MKIVRIIRGIAGAPLNQTNPLRALRQALAYQIVRRILPMKIVVPYVDELRLLIGPGQTAANANYYNGLFELDEQCFLGHLARSGDLFVDVGANVGTFALIPASRGAHVVAFEPASETCPHLLDNIRINGLGSMIEVDTRALTDRSGRLTFTFGRGSTNRVVRDAAQHENNAHTREVEGVTLDDALGGRSPVAVKLDVEGHELSVLRGATQTLGGEEPLAVVVEVRRENTGETGHSRHTGHSGASGASGASHESEIRAIMDGHGMEARGYDPFSRQLVGEAQRPKSRNVIFVRDEAFFAARLRDAAAIHIRGESL
ncbi:MAG: FkbM family methyltransferase [Pirellulaceae bacterium]